MRKLSFFNFNANWNTRELMVLMGDGEDDEYFILFNNSKLIGVTGKVSLKYSSISKSKISFVIKKIPKVYKAFCYELAFSISEMSFCFWIGGCKWVCTPKNYNLEYLEFFGRKQSAPSLASEYCEINIPQGAVVKCR